MEALKASLGMQGQTKAALPAAEPAAVTEITAEPKKKASRKKAG